MLEKLKERLVTFVTWAMPIAGALAIWLFKHRADEYERQLEAAKQQKEADSNSKRITEIATIHKQVQNDGNDLAQKEALFRDTLKHLDD